MLDISISYNRRADSEKLISHLIHYPDGVSRILTMKQFQWDWIEIAERHNYPFSELLQAAVELSYEYPSARGYHVDTLENTVLMLRVTMQGVHEKSAGKAANA